MKKTNYSTTNYENEKQGFYAEICEYDGGETIKIRVEEGLEFHGHERLQDLYQFINDILDDKNWHKPVTRGLHDATNM